MVENTRDYFQRKTREIIDLLETAKHADAVMTFDIHDTISINPNGISTPTKTVTVKINESRVNEWLKKS